MNTRPRRCCMSSACRFRRGVPVLKASDSDAAAKALPGPIWVVKSQIHAGGRGKGKFKEASAGDKGGVRIAKSVAEVNEFAKQMLGATLVTVQTGAARQAGQPPLHRGRLRHRQGVLSLDPGRPRNLRSVVRGLDRRRREHRGRRAQHAGKDRHLLGRSGDRHHGPSRPHGGEGARISPAISPSRRKSW